MGSTYGPNTSSSIIESTIVLMRLNPTSPSLDHLLYGTQKIRMSGVPYMFVVSIEAVKHRYGRRKSGLLCSSFLERGFLRCRLKKWKPAREKNALTDLPTPTSPSDYKTIGEPDEMPWKRFCFCSLMIPPNFLTSPPPPDWGMTSVQSAV